MSVRNGARSTLSVPYQFVKAMTPPCEFCWTGMSGLEYQGWNIRAGMSGLECQGWNIRAGISGLECQGCTRNMRLGGKLRFSESRG